ncbi:hypothetical protein RhiJN_20899 [Ceratobasidium sp. AG-Ba]|nr:hypothetical protein RhiJN_20899 [Ceratobasidium sp. AG-Ba]
MSDQQPTSDTVHTSLPTYPSIHPKPSTEGSAATAAQLEAAISATAPSASDQDMITRLSAAMSPESLKRRQEKLNERN